MEYPPLGGGWPHDGWPRGHRGGDHVTVYVALGVLLSHRRGNLRPSRLPLND